MSEPRLITAHARYLRVAPRKMRLVLDAIRDLPLDRALNELHFFPQAAAPVIEKAIRSAVANAKHNHNIPLERLAIATLVANEGPRLKRSMPRARGRAFPIMKRTTHLTVVLRETMQQGSRKQPSHKRKGSDV
ncbi:MAG: 50S ribosomal protein L22 [Parcubacteria group bacterium]|nr:50S ribosomal protein L22 [Parcubacteria group bacterium]